MASVAFQCRLIERAMEICGGPAALCLRLGIHEHSLKLWLEDRAGMPGRVFLALADVVLEDDIARASQDRRTGPRSDASPPPADGASSRPA